MCRPTHRYNFITFGIRQQPVGLIKPVGLCSQVLQHSDVAGMQNSFAISGRRVRYFCSA